MKKECIFLLCKVENGSKMRCINPWGEKRKEGIAEDRVYVAISLWDKQG